MDNNHETNAIYSYHLLALYFKYYYRTTMCSLLTELKSKSYEIDNYYCFGRFLDVCIVDVKCAYWNGLLLSVT